MAFTYDLATDRGKVRLLIQDNVEAYEFFTDADIDAFLTIAGGLDGSTVMHAAALSLESWASNQLMVLKVMQLLDVRVDGAAVAREMRMRAGILREQAYTTSTDAGFEIAEMALGHFSWVEQVTNASIEDV